MPFDAAIWSSISVAGRPPSCEFVECSQALLFTLSEPTSGSAATMSRTPCFQAHPTQSFHQAIQGVACTSASDLEPASLIPKPSCTYHYFT